LLLNFSSFLSTPTRLPSAACTPFPFIPPIPFFLSLKMYSTLLTVALFFATALQGAVADFAVNNPDFVQCGPAKISWAQTGNPPYSVTIVDAQDPCGTPLADLGDLNDTFVSWTNNVLPAGKQVEVSVEDSEGNEAWSGPLTVGQGASASCLAVSSASNASGSTVVIKPAATSSPSTSSPSESVVPIGAANAGTNPFSNSAPNTRQLNTPVMIFSVLTAAVVLTL